MRRVPTIKSAMRPFPFAIQVDADLAEAKRLFAEHGIRHLPVVDGERLVGLISRHGAERAEALALAQGAVVPNVREVATASVYTVALDEPLDNVLLHMAARGLGSALVVRNGRVVGIFTTTDALRAFADHLRRDLPRGGDDAA
jgi:acetoin utilization protein AcuB